MAKVEDVMDRLYGQARVIAEGLGFEVDTDGRSVTAGMAAYVSDSVTAFIVDPQSALVECAIDTTGWVIHVTDERSVQHLVESHEGMRGEVAIDVWRSVLMAEQRDALR